MCASRGCGRGIDGNIEQLRGRELIEVKGLTKRYRRGYGRITRALKSLDLEVESGATVTVVGRNGAGKSTLFGVLAGLVQPDGGQVRLNGQPPAGFVRAHGIGLLPDRVRFPARRRVRDILVRLAILDGLSGRELAASVDHALEEVGLTDRVSERCGSLSRGLRQRLGIAQLLMRPRSILLLDEPLTGLDPVWRARFREILDRLSDGTIRRTIRLSSHELGEAARMTARVIVLDEGRIVDEFPTTTGSDALESRVLRVLSGGAMR